MSYLLIKFCCFIGLGFLVGDQFVRYIEHITSKTKPSYIKYMIGFTLHLLLAFSLIYIMAITQEFQEERHWVISLLPIVFSVLTSVLTVKILYKRKKK